MRKFHSFVKSVTFFEIQKTDGSVLATGCVTSRSHKYLIGKQRCTLWGSVKGRSFNTGTNTRVTLDSTLFILNDIDVVQA